MSARVRGQGHGGVQKHPCQGAKGQGSDGMSHRADVAGSEFESPTGIGLQRTRKAQQRHVWPRSCREEGGCSDDRGRAANLRGPRLLPAMVDGGLGRQESARACGCVAIPAPQPGRCVSGPPR